MSYQNTPDLALWECCRQNDLKAFNELFHRYSRRLYKQAARYISNTDMAEELMLDLMFELWQKRHQRTIKGEISAYLYRCMRNKIVDYRRRIIPFTTPIESVSENTLKEQEQTDHGLMTADAERLYQSVLENMSPQRRRVFQLSREENLTYAEIAKEMNLSVNTVENYMVAALQTFRNGLKDYISVTNLSLFLLLAANDSFFFV